MRRSSVVSVVIREVSRETCARPTEGSSTSTATRRLTRFTDGSRIAEAPPGTWRRPSEGASDAEIRTCILLPLEAALYVDNAASERRQEDRPSPCQVMSHDSVASQCLRVFIRHSRSTGDLAGEATGFQLKRMGETCVPYDSVRLDVPFPQGESSESR